MDYAERMREQFEQLPGGLSGVAKLLGVHRNTVYNWLEKGSAPMDKMLELEKHGLDLPYVLWGEEHKRAAQKTVHATFEEKLELLGAATQLIKEVTREVGIDVAPGKAATLVEFVYKNQLDREQLRRLLALMQ